MRVAYICADPGVPVWGHKGCSIHVQEVIDGLCRRGARVDLFASRVGGNGACPHPAVALRRLPSPGKCEAARRELACLAANLPLQQILEDSGDFDLIYERYSLWSYGAMEYARAKGVPGLLEVNAPLIEESRLHRRLVHEKEAREASRRALTAAGHVIAVSRELTSYVQALGGSAEKMHVVPNGVDPQRFLPSANPGVPRPFTVGFAGGLRPWHDLPTLLEAFRLLLRREADCRLLIVGDGPGRSALSAQLAATSGEGTTLLPGAVPAAQMPSMLQQMDAGAAPYAALENFYFSPLKIFEYMAAGLPVVTSRIGQPARVIEDELSGLLYTPGDPEELSECLLRLKRDLDLRRRLGLQARRIAVEKHSWDERIGRILRISRIDALSRAGVS